MLKEIDRARQFVNPCPLYNEAYQDSCEVCNSKTECMLTEILNRLRTIEAALGKGKPEGRIRV